VKYIPTACSEWIWSISLQPGLFLFVNYLWNRLLHICEFFVYEFHEGKHEYLLLLLQAMLPWVTTALTEEEQNTMMDTWRQATRNTMFDKWLSAWWKDTPASTSQSPKSTEESTIPPSGTSESLQMVADYLADGASVSSQTMVREEMRDSEDIHTEDTLGTVEESTGICH
jgi:hypothetical protein